MSDEPTEVIVCAGPPICLLEDEDAIRAAQNGCPNCRHIVIHPDGGEREYQRRAN